jgi:hypothetical protein
MQQHDGDVPTACTCLQAAHVATNEEGCYAYELCVSGEHPEKFIIYERWGLLFDILSSISRMTMQCRVSISSTHHKSSVTERTYGVAAPSWVQHTMRRHAVLHVTQVPTSIKPITVSLA